MNLPPASSTSGQDFVIDPKNVGQLRTLTQKSPEQGVKAVAQQFEALLMQQMLKSMRDATPQYDSLETSNVKMFQGMFDEQLTSQLSKKGGLGLADAIVHQIQLQQDPSLLQKPYHTPPNPLASSTLGSSGDTAKQNAGAAKDAATGGKSGSFVARIAGAAQSAGEQLGVSPHVLVAQAALETGWGKKPLTDAAGNDTHNLFGIKAGKDWQGKTATVTTTEYVNGVAQKKVDTFRAYDSYSDAFSDYASLIKRRFGEAVGQGADAKGYGQALQSRGYATDPTYASKLALVAQRVQKHLQGETDV